MSGSATLATDRFKLATAATRISARRTRPERAGASVAAPFVAVVLELIVCPRSFDRRSHTLDGLEPPGLDRIEERGVVALVLVRVPLGEAPDRPFEPVRRSQIGGDGDGVARPRMGPGQRPSAQVGVEGEPDRLHDLDVHRLLHVAKLPPVVVTIPVEPLRPA